MFTRGWWGKAWLLFLFSLSVVFDSFWVHGLQACQASLSSTIIRSMLKFISIEAVIPCNHLILCLPLLLQPSLFPSIRVFSEESALCIRWPKCWSFNFSISPSKENSRFISFKIDCFVLLAFQGTLKSLLQHHSSKASVIWCSVFLMVQLSHPYMTTGKTIALTYVDLCQQSNVSAFNSLCRVSYLFLQGASVFYNLCLQ